MKSPPRRHRLVRTICATVLQLAAVSAMLGAEPPELDQILTLDMARTPDISPDGTRVAYAQLSRTVSGVETSVIRMVALAGGDSQVIGQGALPRWAPDSSRLACLTPVKGKPQLAIIDPAQPAVAPRLLTHHPNGVLQYCWSPDGRQIAFTAEKYLERPGDEPTIVDVNDVPFRQLWVVDVAGGAIRQLSADGYSVGGYDQWFVDFFSWSPDSTQIAFTRRPSAAAGSHLQGDVAAIDVRSGAVRLLVQREGMDAYPMWSPDGRQIAFVTTGWNNWITTSHLELLDPATGQITRISGDFDEKIRDFYWAPDGRAIYFAAWRGASQQIFRLEVAARQVKPVSDDSYEYTDLSLGRSGMMAFLRESATEPPDVYVTPLARFEPKRLTALQAQVRDWPKLETRVVNWSSFDGMKIEGVLTLPANYRPGERYPLLTHLHGGPHAAEHNGFLRAELQYYAQHGWMIFRPNYRGSGGYGEKFMRADIKGWGVGDYQDVMTGIDWLVAQGLADEARLAIHGMSYGGYLSSWIVTQTHRFKGAVIGAAIIDVPTFALTSDIPGRWVDYLGGDPRLYARHSPSTYVDQVTTPTLLWHGSSDLRVPPSQTRGFYTALRRQGVPVQLLVYPNEGHGLKNPVWQRDLARRDIRWLNEHVLGR